MDYIFSVLSIFDKNTIIIQRKIKLSGIITNIENYLK